MWWVGATSIPLKDKTGVRIIAGVRKGAALASPKGMDTRPTPDKVRGALFNIIGADIEGAYLLDLFGGSGAIGLEALSRGASSVTIVDNATAELVKKNAEKLKLADGLKIIGKDVFSAIAKLAVRGAKFDFIFADPPWKAGLEEKIVEKASGVLASDGLLILEANAKTVVPESCGEPALSLVRVKKYGDAALNFYEFAQKVK